ncbi:MAG: YicC/YloC family endoribonuclease [Pseudomonadota bacterium]
MFTSMTGFAQESKLINGSNYYLEIKTVNNKYLDLKFKLPRFYSRWEHQLIPLVKKHLSRGRVDVFLNIEKNIESKYFSDAHKKAIKDYLEGLKSIKAECNLEDEVKIDHVTGFLNNFQEMDNRYIDKDFEAFAELFEQTLKSLNKMRQGEGENLKKDILEHKENVVLRLLEIESKKDEVLNKLTQKVKDRISKLLTDVDIDEQRFNQEIAYITDKADITEEITRIKSHLAQFDEFIEAKGDVGRKVDFLLQELQREFNTLSVKSREADISSHVIFIKSELEKIKEQIQNVE